MKINRISPLTSKINTMDLDITVEQINLWKNGMCIQDVFPNLDENEREFIQTGYTKEDWDNMFPPEESDEDDDFE